jgi:hypothetical protein
VPEFKRITKRFFEEYVKEKRYLSYISDVVVRGLEAMEVMYR